MARPPKYDADHRADYRLLKARGWRQRDIALALGVSDRVIRRWEQQERQAAR